MNERERGRIEALIDGEGCIRLFKERNYETLDASTWKCRLTLTNTNKDLVAYAQKIIGGSVRIQRDREGNRKAAYVLTICHSVIGKLLPHLSLIVKERQRRLILEALPIIQRRRGGWGRFHRTDQEFIDSTTRLETIYKEISELNRRGTKLE